MRKEGKQSFSDRSVHKQSLVARKISHQQGIGLECELAKQRIRDETLTFWMVKKPKKVVYMSLDVLGMKKTCHNANCDILKDWIQNGIKHEP